MPPLKRDPSLIPLSHDHHEGLLRAFFVRQAVRSGQGLDHQASVTRDFFEKNLRPHFRAEEEVLFPLMRPLLGAGDASIDRLLAEHREIESQMANLDASTERLTALADLLDRHIRAEERQLFERYQELIPPADRPRIEAALREVLARPVGAPVVCSIEGIVTP